MFFSFAIHFPMNSSIPSTHVDSFDYFEISLSLADCMDERNYGKKR